MEVKPDRRLVVVGIQGAMGSGKSTIRDHLVKGYGAQWIPMSGALKRALVAMGADEADIYDPSRKELPNPLFCGKTNRHALQTIGTEWGRELIGPDIWVNCAKKEVLSMLQWDFGDERNEQPLIVVFDDVRFPNEYEMVKQFGGTIWTVRRPEVEPPRWKQWVVEKFGFDSWITHWLANVHPSERWWIVAPSDFEFWNVTTTEELREGVVTQMLQVFEAHEEKWS